MTLALAGLLAACGPAELDTAVDETEIIRGGGGGTGGCPGVLPGDDVGNSHDAACTAPTSQITYNLHNDKDIDWFQYVIPSGRTGYEFRLVSSNPNCTRFIRRFDGTLAPAQYPCKGVRGASTSVTYAYRIQSGYNPSTGSWGSLGGYTVQMKSSTITGAPGSGLPAAPPPPLGGGIGP